MRLLITLLVLQLVVTTHGFRRLGTINSVNISGRVYLIDTNTIFLYHFNTPWDLSFNTSSGSQYTLTGPKANHNAMYDLSADILYSPYLNVKNGSALIASFYIPNNVYVPCNAEYLGQFNIPGTNSTYHDLDGHVFMDRSQRRFFVAGFNLDGDAPFSFFWFDVGENATASGIKTAASHTQYEILTFSPYIDVNVTFPPGYTNTQFQTLSVWCVDFYVSFGQVTIPAAASDAFTCDSFGPEVIANSPLSHDVTADMYILGPTTIGLNKLYFDGSAPATWYWTGMNSSLPDGYIVRDQFSSLAKLDIEIINDNIVLSLPQGTDVCTAEFFSVYCVNASVSFATLNITESFNCSYCPPTCKTNVPDYPIEYQCKDVGSKIRVEYLFDGANNAVTFRYHTCGLEANQYIALGLSGSDTIVSMVGGDVIICYYTTTGEGYCSDYKLTSRSQCADTNSDGNFAGACPDEVLGGVDDTYNTQVEYLNGKTTFTTTRAIDTGDANDTVKSSTVTHYVIWSIGATFESPGGGRWPLKHAVGDRASGDSPIPGLLSNNSTCEGYFECAVTPPPEPTPWIIPPICIDDNSAPIKAYIGNTGGQLHGYSAITGKDGWGISWYLNGLLVPEVYILRGSTVSFEVYGGNDPSSAASYHPLYITSSDEGGIAGGAPSGETVFAGLDDSGASPVSLTTGDFCEWSQTGGSGNHFSTWNAYKNSLESICPAGSTPGTFEWTTSATTPDTVYYQCATHRLLGWKINVVDDLTTCLQLAGTTTTPTPLPTATIIIISAVAVFVIILAILLLLIILVFLIIKLYK